MADPLYYIKKNLRRLLASPTLTNVKMYYSQPIWYRQIQIKPQLCWCNGTWGLFFKAVKCHTHLASQLWSLSLSTHENGTFFPFPPATGGLSAQQSVCFKLKIDLLFYVNVRSFTEKASSLGQRLSLIYIIPFEGNFPSFTCFSPSS